VSIDDITTNGHRTAQLSALEQRNYVDWIKDAVDRARADLADRVADAARLRGEPFTKPDLLEEQFEAGDAAVTALRNIAQSRLRDGQPLLSVELEEELKAAAVNASIGLGPLQAWFDHPDVEEVCVNAEGHSFVWWGAGPAAGHKTYAGRLFSSDDDTIALGQRVVRTFGIGGQRLDPKTPFVRVDLPGGHRFVAVLGGDGKGGVSSGPLISLRRKRIERPTLDELVARHMLPHRLALQAAIATQAGLGQLDAGPMGSGKTTFMSAKLHARNPDERTGTFERDVMELTLADPDNVRDVVAFYTRSANTEGEGEIELGELIARNRQLRLDRVNVGELVHGPDAWEMLIASSGATYRSLTTLHADDPTIVLDRLALYCAAHHDRPEEWRINRMISQTIDLIFFVDLVTIDGRRERRITSVREVGGMVDDGAIASSEIWAYNDDTDTLEQISAYSPNLLNRIRRHGHPIDAFTMPGHTP